MLYDANVATISLPALPILGDTTPPYRVGRAVNSTDINIIKAARLAILNEVARQANANAIVVSYIQANGHAVISAESCGRTPNPNNANTAILAPSVPVNLSIV
jgi:hypothetical protein